MFIAILGSIIFFIISIVYILVALGKPLGEYVMGGKDKLVAKNMRIVILVSVLVQWFAILILLQTAGILPLIFSALVTRRICIFLSVYLSINVLMNLFSRSKKERYTMTPLSLIVAISFWMTALM
ncbi:hypothetical protein EZV73_19905 [Acidaminobacter sp. JC074]|uniref:hypothetical protein n=1 Tax=Acidaminobacter sp. JC074 TaxID=2530199 RepID=UPI001F0EA062|nr:hypothetical protein [Acidaminobacter sp. JC074]MCH4889858.1 hypothetical protein [Acidaminobacter sp. JC074]